jgi:Bacterial Ig domain
MIQHLRSRLRAVVAMAICTLVAAPALVSGTASIAAAAPPGINSATLTVNGEGTGLATNPWHWDGGGYSELRAALLNPNNFGASGVFKKGTFAIPAASITTGLSFPGTLSNLDVFFAGLPTSDYSVGEMAALQAFNADGRALVLNANAPNFGDVAAFLGFTLRTQRAFFGNDSVCGWTNNGPGGSESAAANSIVAGGQGSHPVVAGPFGTASTVSNYHTVEVFTGLPAQAQTLYNLTVAGQAPQLAVTGPIGETSTTVAPITHVSFQAAVVAGTINISTAALTPGSITSVAFYHDDASVPANLISTDLSFPFDASWNTAAAAPLGVADGIHPVIAHVVPTVGSPFNATLDFGVNVDNVAPFVTPIPGTANISYDCPGAGGETINNNISGATVAVIPAKALSANSGPIVVTSDLDSMSNAFDGSWTQNKTFALNAFAWVMDSMLPDVPDDTYFPLTNPVRVYDSRPNNALAHGETRLVQVAGVGGVPADAKTVIANVTVVDPDSSGYFTVFPTGSTQPNTSTHNFGTGENFANMVTMQVGSNGRISVFAFLNSGGGFVDALVDIVGYTRRDNSGTRLHTMAPNRLLDTRNGIGIGLTGSFGAGGARNLTVRGGSTGVPSDAESVVLNMTVTNVTRDGSFITVWPAGSPQPVVSNLNNVQGIARPNLVVARVGTGGQISIVNDSGTADIIADVVGYFSAGAYKSGGVITGLTPIRILDTRSPSNAFGPGQVRSYTVAGVGGIPGTAKTAILKVTAVDPTAGGFLTVWPAGSSNPPNVSNLNFVPGMTIPNLVITQIGTGGQINIYNAFGSTHVLIDVLGYAD